MALRLLHVRPAQIPTSIMRRRIASLAFAFLVVPHVAESQSLELFFYSPEFAPANLGVLQSSVEGYMRAQNVSVRFQAFARFEDLRTEFSKRKVAFAVLPPWIVEHECLGRTLNPIAEPIRNGTSLDRKIVVVSRRTAKDLRTASIAVSGPRGRSGGPPPLLAKFVASYPRVKIINVPKDVDALLAVSFGQVEAAFVSSAQFEILAHINPAMTATLEETGYTAESPFPRLYATDAATPEHVARVRQAAVAMGESNEGKRLLRLLGYDRWRAIDGDDRTMSRPCARDGEETKR